MSMFDRIERARLENLHFRHDPKSGLKAIIAIHNTRLGPALGGCRFVSYASEDDALDDVIRLARGMSYKAALAGVPQGGGKAVILKPADSEIDREALYKAFGHFVDSLGGRYITAADSGTQLADLDQVARVTPYVSGTSTDGFNPSPITALGVYAGIKAAVLHQLKRDSLSGLHIAIQGVGNVGMALASLLFKDGVRLSVSDVDPARTALCQQSFNANVVASNNIIEQQCDVFAPCGLGGVIHEGSLPLINCAIVAGAANNQLASSAMGVALHQQGILYAPDYVINAGGLICVSLGYTRQNTDSIQKRTLGLGDTLKNLFERSLAENRPTSQIADEMAEEIIYR